MTKVLLLKNYKARKTGAILDVPQGEADSIVAIGLGQIFKEEEAPKKGAKVAAAE